MRRRENTSDIHLWNVVVLTKRLELRVELMNAVLMRLSCQFLHFIGKLRVTSEYKKRWDPRQVGAPVSAGPPGSVSRQQSFAHH
jgi:hypothetical protein